MVTEQVSEWFLQLADEIVQHIILIEQDQCRVVEKNWQRPGGGGGRSRVIYGAVFEKIGVNFSVVNGKFSEEFRAEIPGAIESEGEFWASGISLVAHMNSPLIPAVHMNTRMLKTSLDWFGGGIDITPTFTNPAQCEFFHAKVKEACDRFDPDYYAKFSQACNEYFFLPHRNEPRGAGGIFIDNLQGDFLQNFDFIKAVGNLFVEAFLPLVYNDKDRAWSSEEKESQLIKRGRYVEFNLLYDRGTRFGLKTGGDPEAIMMSMPPLVRWL